MWLLIAEFVFVLCCFIYASYSDLRTREVPNNLWVLMLPPGLVAFYFAFSAIAILNVLIISALSMSIFYLGLMGGADAKAIMILALFFPHAVNGYPFVFLIVLLSMPFMLLLYGRDLLNLKEKKPRPYLPAMTAAIPCAFALTLLL